MRAGMLEWQEPSEENVHVEVSVRDAADNRFIPGLDVSVRLLGDAGEEVAAGTLPMLWHPWLYHYGSKFTIPGDGTYSVTVEVAAPTFGRHDQENGERYTDDVIVEFAGVAVETGKG